MTALILAAISLLTIYSASSSGSGQDVVIKQAGWFVIGFLLIAAVTSVLIITFSARWHILLRNGIVISRGQS